MGIKFQNEKNVFVAPFSTSWGTSTRSIGAVTKNNWDEKGLIIPFDVAPVQIGLIKIEQETELEQYSKKILQKLRKKYRCEVYADRNFGKNLAKADAEGCVFKIIIGKKDIANNSVTVIVRDKLKIKEEVQKEKIAEFLKNKAKDFKKRLKKKNSLLLERSLLKVETEAERIKEIKNGEKKIFLINFCDKNNCEEILKKKIVHYSIRCLEKVKKMSRCLFCERETFFQAFVGRSY